MIQDQVDAAAVGGLLDDGGEVLARVVDHVRGAELEYPLPLAGRCGDVDLCLRRQQRAQVECRRVDATAAAMKQGPLAVTQAADREDVQVRGDVGLADAGSLFEARGLGNREGVAGVGGGILGVAAAGHQAHDAVAYPPAVNALAVLCDRAGHLEAEDLGLAGWGRVVALALDDVGAVDGRGRDFDEELAGSGRRALDLAQAHDLWATGPVQQDGSHRIATFALRGT